MRPTLKTGAVRGLATFAAVLCASVLLPGLALAGGPGLALTNNLAPQVLAASPLPPADVVDSRILVADSQSDAQVTVRVQALEDAVRTLTGQVDGLQFQLTQMQELIQKMQQDDEFRFEQLEGGAGKKSSAATHSGGVTPSGALPQGQAGAEQSTDNPPADAPAADAGNSGDATPPPADATNNADGNSTATVNDGLGQSQDPLLKGGSPTLGAEPGNGNGQPLNLNLDATSSQALSNGDSAAQYKAGYDAILRGDYPFAEDQFRQFIALYPKDPQAPDATNWLGEALLQRQAYDDAADVLLTGFQNYEHSARAPDLLLKLGIALAGAGQQDTACRTFAEVLKRYPKQPQAFLQRLSDEKTKAQCPA
ncbi:MAG TPA: tol-pal system protein YbgF [Devosia sp.]|nr:tol-pal system protein YbgF [Devosia sp.]